MKDIKLNNNYDLSIENDDVIFVSDAEELEQRLKIKYQTFFQEWFLDETVGIDWFGQILGANKNINLIDNILIITATEEPEIEGLISYSSNIDAKNRILSVNFVAQTIYGNLSFSQEIEILR